MGTDVGSGAAMRASSLGTWWTGVLLSEGGTAWGVVIIPGEWEKPGQGRLSPGTNFIQARGEGDMISGTVREGSGHEGKGGEPRPPRFGL